mmetsp:Transcript_1694/g.6770  ORF Transcript_1694/g.6770 Transcript_1694/m.6770 type:complete len:200 (+) Transcript_1694:13025-13624(+)
MTSLSAAGAPASGSSKSTRAMDPAAFPMGCPMAMEISFGRSGEGARSPTDIPNRNDPEALLTHVTNLARPDGRRNTKSTPPAPFPATGAPSTRSTTPSPSKSCAARDSPNRRAVRIEKGVSKCEGAGMPLRPGMSAVQAVTKPNWSGRAFTSESDTLERRCASRSTSTPPHERGSSLPGPSAMVEFGAETATSTEVASA